MEDHRGGQGLGTMEEDKGGEPQRTAGALSSHPARGGWIYPPTGDWGSCKLLIITLFPACLSFFPTICLTH